MSAIGLSNGFGEANNFYLVCPYQLNFFLFTVDSRSLSCLMSSHVLHHLFPQFLGSTSFQPPESSFGVLSSMAMARVGLI